MKNFDSYTHTHTRTHTLCRCVQLGGVQVKVTGSWTRPSDRDTPPPTTTTSSTHTQTLPPPSHSPASGTDGVQTAVPAAAGRAARLAVCGGILREQRGAGSGRSLPVWWHVEQTAERGHTLITIRHTDVPQPVNAPRGCQSPGAVKHAN